MDTTTTSGSLPESSNTGETSSNVRDVPRMFSVGYHRMVAPRSEEYITVCSVRDPTVSPEDVFDDFFKSGMVVKWMIEIPFVEHTLTPAA